MPYWRRYIDYLTNKFPWADVDDDDDEEYEKKK